MTILYIALLTILYFVTIFLFACWLGKVLERAAEESRVVAWYLDQFEDGR